MPNDDMGFSLSRACAFAVSASACGNWRTVDTNTGAGAGSFSCAGSGEAGCNTPLFPTRSPTTIPLPLPDSYNQSVLPAGLLLPLRRGPGRRAHGFRRQSLLLLLVHVGIAFCG